MQKVVGSSPIIRSSFLNPLETAGFFMHAGSRFVALQLVD
jgi:hypothetical protein